MLIAALKNYIKYFRKYFKCLAIISLSILLLYIIFNVTILIPIKNLDIDNYNSFYDTMQNYLEGLSISDIFSRSFLGDTVKDIYSIFNDANPSMNIGTILIVISLIIVIGAFVYSQFDCKRAIKDDVWNRDTAKVRKQVIFKTIVNALFWVVFLLITMYWGFAIVLLPFILVLLGAVKILLSTWYIYFKKYRFFQFVNFSNSIRLVVTNLILMYLHSVLFYYIAPHVSLYILLLLALSFFAYTSSVMEFTATKYFISKRKSHQLDIA